MLTYASAQQQFVIRASNNAVTEPVGGSWLAAYAIYLGATEPNGTWLQTICELTGITEPVNGSWIQALAAHYGITQPISGNYWIDLAEATFEPPTPPFQKRWFNFSFNNNYISQQVKGWLNEPFTNTQNNY